ncbi:MAG: hypothetical protein HY735_38355 [Verrucomicrobia bacterium]|nr:hypothetical protein [Verrucomicrobiota bacterium]
MKAHLLLLAAICVVSNRPPAFAENDTPVKAEPAPIVPASSDEAKKGETSAEATTGKAAATTQPTDLAKRIEAVVNKKSEVVQAIADMAEKGVEPSVIEAYVQTVNLSELRSDEILYLHNHGVSSPVITALIKRAGEVRGLQAQAHREAQERLAQQRTAQAANNAVQPSPPPVAPQAPVYNYYVSTPPPAYTYSYPVYTYATYPLYSFSYAWPYYRNYSSATCPPLSYATRFQNFHYSHNPHASLSVGIHTPRSPSFFSSRWMVTGTTGKPVDFHR